MAHCLMGEVNEALTALLALIFAGACMRACVLSGQCACGAWEVGPRSAAELKEAATHFERCAALCPAPVGKAHFAGQAAWCRSQADAM